MHLREEANSNSDFVHGFLRRKRVLQSRKYVAHTNEDFWSIWKADKIQDSHLKFYFLLSLIFRERGHHELGIVLTAIFFAATGNMRHKRHQTSSHLMQGGEFVGRDV